MTTCSVAQELLKMASARTSCLLKSTESMAVQVWTSSLTWSFTSIYQVK